MSILDSLSERLAALSPAKRELLEREMRRRNVAPAPNTISRRKNDAHLPLSFGQQRLWFLSELEPQSFVYNEPYAVRLRGSLNVDAVRLALGAVVERHEVLRTSFVLFDGTPQQQIAPARTFDLPFIDLSSHAPDVAEAEAQKYSKEFVRQPFDLHRDLLLRACLLRLADDDHIFVFLTHHIASDGWSRGILFDEIGAFYEDFANGSAPWRQSLPVQYADYAIWQRQSLQGAHLERQLAYWREELRGAPVLELPTTHTRPATQRYTGANYSFEFSSGLSSRLAAFNRLESVTPFMTLLGAFQVLLSRWSGQEEIVVGSPIANRQRVELEGLIGFFVNTLVLRGDLSGEPGFREVVRRIRGKALDAYSHQDLPFDKLVEELNPERDLSRHPLFQVMFVLQNAPAHPLVLNGLEMSPYPVSTDSIPLDLELHLAPKDDTYIGMISYDTDLFDLATIQRMAGHYATLLESMLAAPDLSVFKATMLPPAERHQLLVQWNDKTADYGSPECLHRLFEQQAAKSPDRIALQFGDDTLTYGELDRRANGLARELRNIGVRRETRVGICVERSLDMVIALLAILKAGGTYVPIDSHFPA
ncbi:MAG TPA: condensation domain-containing protein, partial [Chthoniobacterales bacterium]